MESIEQSPWYIVDAKVELSITPMQISNGGFHARRAAEQQAFSSFFMRYSRQLGGIPVASQGPLRYPDGKIRLIGASPFAHVTAEATVLLFAPEKGTTLTGRVIHIGPDHVGLTVMRSFHSVLPLSEFYNGYRLHTQKKDGGGLERFWKYTGVDSPMSKRPAVRIGSWIKFSVKDVRGTKTGLFDIYGTLKAQYAEERGLGFIHPEDDDDDQQPEESVSQTGGDSVDAVRKGRPLRRRLADDDLFAEMDTFNDDFADMLDNFDCAPLVSSSPAPLGRRPAENELASPISNGTRTKNQLADSAAHRIESSILSKSTGTKKNKNVRLKGMDGTQDEDMSRQDLRVPGKSTETEGTITMEKENVSMKEVDGGIVSNRKRSTPSSESAAKSKKKKKGGRKIQA